MTGCTLSSDTIIFSIFQCWYSFILREKRAKEMLTYSKEKQMVSGMLVEGVRSHFIFPVDFFPLRFHLICVCGFPFQYIPCVSKTPSRLSSYSYSLSLSLSLLFLSGSLSILPFLLLPF